MWSRFHLGSILLCSLLSRASSPLSINVAVGTPENLNILIEESLNFLEKIVNSLGVQNFVTYNGCVELVPSLQQRVMEKFTLPVYNVGFDLEEMHNHHYTVAENIVIVLFTGINDPVLLSLEKNERNSLRKIFLYIYVSPPGEEMILAQSTIQAIFKLSWSLGFDRTILGFQGKNGVEYWLPLIFANMVAVKVDPGLSFLKNVKKIDYKFLVKVVNDPPVVFWAYSYDQSDINGGGNISIYGPIGTVVVEFMRHLNATMEIMPIAGIQSGTYDIMDFEASGRKADLWANLVADESDSNIPIKEGQMCLLIPQHRLLPIEMFLNRMSRAPLHLFFLPIMGCVLVIKYLAHRRRSFCDALFQTIRFGLVMPLHGDQLVNLPVADRILEVVSFFGFGIVGGIAVSIASTALTTGMYEPLITDVESMLKSGLPIISCYPDAAQAFGENRLPKALEPLYQNVSLTTFERMMTELNESYTYIVRTPNYYAMQLYQERLKFFRLQLSGEKLCSPLRQLRLSLPRRSSLRIPFEKFFTRIIESGLLKAWYRMGFQMYRKIKKIDELPIEDEMWWPLPLDFFITYIKFFLGGCMLSTLVFFLELFYKRFRTAR